MGRRELLVDILLPVTVAILLIGVLVGVTGTWPPMVAVESGSMEPNANTGDLIIVSSLDRFDDDAETHGIVTEEEAKNNGHERIGSHGDVIVFTPPEWTASPIFHRAAFYVTAGEDWTDRADPTLIPTTDCDELRNCPAPNDGYITHGDNNSRYDQVSGTAPPVKPEWIEAKGQARIPKIGWLRLVLAG